MGRVKVLLLIYYKFLTIRIKLMHLVVIRANPLNAKIFFNRVSVELAKLKEKR